MQWRNLSIRAGLWLAGHQTYQHIQTIQEWDSCSPAELQGKQKQQLATVVAQAWKAIPYYRRILTDAGVVRDGHVNLDQFSTVPVLTKEIVRREFDQLHVRRYRHYGGRLNTSGGSTGEPLQLIQDRCYRDWNVASKVYFKLLAGQQAGDRELRLWGSERDILEGRERLSIRARNWLYNRQEWNAFRMSPADFPRFADAWNTFRPQWIEAYVQSLYEFAQFVRAGALQLYVPRGIVVTAGVLHPPVKQFLQETFRCPILNRYGSREVGDIACSCAHGDALHVSTWQTYVEVLDGQLQPVAPGETGDVYVTTLRNQCMPLIRYAIGDRATILPVDAPPCTCGRISPRLAAIVGREVNIFVAADGSLIDGEYFTHLFYFKTWCRQFQVVQQTPTDVQIAVVLLPPAANVPPGDAVIIEQDIRRVLGISCSVSWQIVPEIAPTASGKHLYTISHVQRSHSYAKGTD